MPGIGLSMRRGPSWMLDVDIGAYLASARENPRQERADGGFLRLAASYVRESGSWDLLAGFQANLFVANDIYTKPNGTKATSSYTGLLPAVHLGAAYTTGAAHQVGVRIGYTPILVEGAVLPPFDNIMSHVYFRYSL